MPELVTTGPVPIGVPGVRIHERDNVSRRDLTYSEIAVPEVLRDWEFTSESGRLTCSAPPGPGSAGRRSVAGWNFFAMTSRRLRSWWGQTAAHLGVDVAFVEKDFRVMELRRSVAVGDEVIVESNT